MIILKPIIFITLQNDFNLILKLLPYAIIINYLG